MRTLYATQFEIRRPAHSPSEVAGLVGEEIIQWMVERYDPSVATALRRFDGVELSPEGGHLLRASTEVCKGHAVVAFEWAYPHSGDRSLQWHSQAVVAVTSAAVEFSLLVRIGAPTFSVRPLEFDLGRPRIVRRLLEMFQCVSGGQTLQADAMNVDLGTVKDFVHRVLLSEERRMPVVVVSPNVWTDVTTVDASRMQDALAGVAVVALLTSKWAAYELTDHVGARLSCYGGAVRVYWPGFRIDMGESWRHRLFLAESIQEHESKGRSLAHHLFRTFAALAAFRYAEGATTKEARKALATANRERFEQLVELSKAGNRSADEELLQILEDNSRLEGKLAEAEGRLAELQRDLETARENIAAMGMSYDRPGEAGAQEPGDDQEAAVRSVIEALEQVAEAFADSVVVFKSARESATASDFARPEDIKKALIAVAELSRLYFATKGKQSIGRWEDYFQQRGIKYAPTESQTTTTMYGDDRKFTHDGRKVQMFKHLTIGKGDTKNCVQIYFEPNGAAKRFDIGYCGRHLPYAKA